MPKFLLDENLSQETANFLNALGYDAKTVAHFRLAGAEDQKVADKAAATRRILITLDLDFGEMYYFGTSKKLGIVVLRLKDQTVESVNSVLKKLLNSQFLNKNVNRSALFVVDEEKIRIRRKF
jgi:predicted nuclease of predicted toxin-antitoxin system